jgi:hypothetical protein
MAIARFALGSGEALGQNQANSLASKAEGLPITYTTTQTKIAEGSCRRKLVGSLPWGIPTVVVYR